MGTSDATTVAFGQPCGVHLERSRPAAAMAEATGDCSQVDAGGDEFSGGVVAEAVELAVDLEARQ